MEEDAFSCCDFLFTYNKLMLNWWTSFVCSSHNYTNSWVWHDFPPQTLLAHLTFLDTNNTSAFIQFTDNDPQLFYSKAPSTNRFPSHYTYVQWKKYTISLCWQNIYHYMILVVLVLYWQMKWASTVPSWIWIWLKIVIFFFMF